MSKTLTLKIGEGVQVGECVNLTLTGTRRGRATVRVSCGQDVAITPVRTDGTLKPNRYTLDNPKDKPLV